VMWHPRGVLFAQKRKFSAFSWGGIFWVVPNLRCSRCHNTNFFEIKEHSQSRNPEGMWFCSMLYYTDCLNIRISERLCVVAITFSCFAMWEARQGFAYGTAGFPVCNRSENNTGSLDQWIEVQEFQFFSAFLYKLFLESKIFLQGKKVVARFGVRLAYHTQRRSSCWGSQWFPTGAGRPAMDLKSTQNDL